MDSNLSVGYSREMESWSASYINVCQLCRICGMPHDYLIPIFDGEGLQYRLESKIQVYLSLQVKKDDILPLNLCYNCASSIISWHSLFINCHEADLKLRTLLGIKPLPELSQDQELNLTPAASTPSQLHLEAHNEQTLTSLKSSHLSIELSGPIIPHDTAQHLTFRNSFSNPVALMTHGSVPHCQLQGAHAVDQDVLHDTVNSTTLSSLGSPITPLPITASAIQDAIAFINVSTQTDLSSECMDKVLHPSASDKKAIQIKKTMKSRTVNSKKVKSPHRGVSSPEESVDSVHSLMDSYDFRGVETTTQRVSAIQSTSVGNNLSPGVTAINRSTSVLVRNEAVWAEPFPVLRGDSLDHFNETVKQSASSDSDVVKGHCEDSGPETSVVLFVRPSCLRRAPTKRAESIDVETEEAKPTVILESFKSHSTQTESKALPIFDSYEGVIVGSSPVDSISQGLTVEEEREVDPSRTCFHCGKVINNLVLLHAHEKKHLSEPQPPTSFVCKFCSQPLNSFSEMHSHQIHHEAEAERQRKCATNRRAFLCKQCGQMFTTEERLSLHQRSHTDGMDACGHTCKTCGEAFSTRSKLSVHLWSHAVKQSHKILKCHICGKGFSTKCAVLEHRLKHSEEERSRAFKCIICGMAFGNNTLLGKHRATHSEEELARPFKCAFCGKAFARNHTLHIHHLTHSDEKSHLCSQCGKGFKLRNSLIQHIRTHQDPSARPTFPCHLCSKTFSAKSRLRDHLRLHSGDKPYVCSTCGKRFHKITALHTHEVSHTERRPYMCDVCGKAFKWSKNLRQHKAVHGNTEGDSRDLNINRKFKVKSQSQPCQCEVCGKQLSGKNSLRRHIANLHNGGTQKQSKSTSCSICGKVLSSAGGLIRHTKITHGGIKAFKCDLCDREYSTKVARDDHRRSHTGERPFKCNVCSKTFSSLSNLHIHRTIHSEERPHKCSFCEKQFKRKAHLILHTRTHTGEKPYICNVCNRGFAQSNDLHKHRITHSNDKAYACHCGMAYRFKRYLVRHQYKHHPSQESGEEREAALHSTESLPVPAIHQSLSELQELSNVGVSESYPCNHIENVYPSIYNSTVQARCSDALLKITD